MDKIKSWISEHKAMSIGIAIAAVALLYLWLTSRSGSAAAAGDGGAMAAYYGAQATASQGAAAEAQASLAAGVEGGKTAAAERVAIAQSQSALDQLMAQLNLVAYQDYLAEFRGTGAATVENERGAFAASGDQLWNRMTTTSGTTQLWNGVVGAGSVVIDPVSGQPQAPGWAPNAPSQIVTWAGPGAGTTPWVKPTPTQPVQFGDFKVPTRPVLH